ncbi:laccase-4-like isoform X2 [Ceratina calcarata]|uniref:Laccase-4-like isoform X2 n=1 Tax=Ceratina calcarata TaxID=156304 RepID=A0AAJ7JBV6_9HYME|nr:laccase-4-like isoform X2 [Ceratina calcarata]
MNTIGGTVLLSILFLTVEIQNAEACIVAGYMPGLSGMVPINKENCMNDELRANSFLSNSLECARTCVAGQTKTCYYKFTVERYPVNGKACDLCMPNATNSLCPECQCVPADGTQRMALTVNRMIPGPSIQVCKGDYVVVDVTNLLKSDSVTIHWHGLFQNGSPHYDGVPFLTQCPIPTQTTFRYQFHANNPGTHFWHAHTGPQKLDGIFGSMIVREPSEYDPSSSLYDFDLANHVIFINDWLSEESTSRIPGRRAGQTRTDAESYLINGKGRFIDSSGATANIPFEVITVDANQRYRFRLINSFCTTCPGELTVEGHNLTVINSDGQPIKPIVVDSLVSLAGERYDFVINTNQEPGAYWIQLRGLDDCSHVQQLAILQYVGASSTPRTEEPHNPLPSEVALDITTDGCYKSTPNKGCVENLEHALPIESKILQKEPDVKLVIPIGLHRFEDEEFYTPNKYKNFLISKSGWTVSQTMSNISSIGLPSPPLSQMEDVPQNLLCNADNLPPHCSSQSVCECVHVIKLPLNSVVEVVLVDEFNTSHVRHPFHLHGFVFYVLATGQPFGPIVNGAPKMTAKAFHELDAANQIDRNLNSPPAKDTLAIPNNGYAVLRFYTDNPGFWIFHCHQLFHLLGGMELIFQVGEVTDMPKTPDNFPRCGHYKPNIKSS